MPNKSRGRHFFEYQERENYSNKWIYSVISAGLGGSEISLGIDIEVNAHSITEEPKDQSRN